MQPATLVERVSRSSDGIRIFLVQNNDTLPEFIAGYTQEVKFGPGLKPLKVVLCQYVSFTGYLGTLEREKGTPRTVEINEESPHYWVFRNLTTGFTAHRKITDRLMQPLLEDADCAHLPSRLRRRRENYAMYLEMARNL